jgi:hypothetical protein
MFLSELPDNITKGGYFAVELLFNLKLTSVTEIKLQELFSPSQKKMP